MSVLMALVDLIPVALFMAAAVILQRGLYDRMSKGAFALFSGGTIMVSAAGIFKATWKLLYGAGICDFQRLNQAFFPMQSLGFLLAGIAVIAMMAFRQSEKSNNEAGGAGSSNGTKLAVAGVPVVFSGTMIFVTLMVAGLGCMNFGLAALAKKQKKTGAMVLFIVAFVFMLMMGYLSSKDFSKAALNWVAEAVNVIGQGLFLLGSIKLTKKEKAAEG